MAAEVDIAIFARAPVAPYFQGIAWAGDTVMAQTRERLRRVGLRYEELAPSWDVDRSEDLGDWPHTRTPSYKEVSMNQLLRFLAALLMSVSSVAFAADGLIAIKSPFSAAETMNRFEANAKQRGLTIFARIDHAVGAAKIGTTLRPTEVLIFGNPQGGTPFMECAQSVGIDLPLKVLVWEDAQGQVWLGYNDPAYLAQRHGVSQCPVVGALSKALSSLAEATIAR